MKKIIYFITDNWFKLCVLLILLLGVYYIGIRPSHLVKKCREDAGVRMRAIEMTRCLITHGYPIELQINH